MKNVTISTDLQKSFIALLKLQAEEKRIRPVVEAYQKKAFGEMEMFDRHTGERVTNFKYAWTAGDEPFLKYHAKCEQYKVQAGFDVPEDHCPLLSVEYEIVKAERSLLDAAKYITGFDADDVSGDLELWAESVRLIKGLIASAPKSKLDKLPLAA